MVCTAFAAVLAARRREFNAWVAEARRLHPGFDQEAFGRFLAESADPVVEAVARAAPERVPEVVSTVLRISLDLVGQRRADASPRTRPLADTWSMVAPCFAPLVARFPEQVLSMLSNAILHLAALPSVSLQRWGGEMAALASQVASLAQLRALGQVLAWRAGAAHYRQGAIVAADGLPDTLALNAFHATGIASWEQLRTQLLGDPWWHPPGDLDAASARTIGAFAGLGGVFVSPPMVRAANPASPTFLVRAGDQDFVLHVDAYGAMLMPAAPAPFEAVASNSGALAHVVRGNELLVGRQCITLALPAERLAVFATDTTIAISSPYTHTIMLVARQ